MRARTQLAYIGVLGFFIALSIATPASSNIAHVRQLDTLLVLPGSSESAEWRYPHHALVQDMRDDSLYQNFNTQNAALFVGDRTRDPEELSTDHLKELEEASRDARDVDDTSSTTQDTIDTGVHDEDLPGETSSEDPVDEPVSETTTSEEVAAPDATPHESSVDTVQETPSLEEVESETPLEAMSKGFFRFVERATRMLPFAQETVVETIPEAPAQEGGESHTVDAEDAASATGTQTETDIHEEDHAHDVVADEETDTPLDTVPPLPVEDAQNSDAPEQATSSPENISEEDMPGYDNAEEGPESSPEEADEELETEDHTDWLVFSDFALPPLESGQFIRNVQLRMSLAGTLHETPDTLPAIDVEYNTGGGWRAAGSVLFDSEISNALNGGYFLFALPTFTDVSDLENLMIRVAYRGDRAVLERLLVDAAWLEVDTETFNRDILNQRINPEAFSHFKLPDMYEYIGSTIDFTREELPQFTLKYESQRNPVVGFFRDLFGRKLIEIERVIFAAPGGDEIPVSPRIDLTQDGLLSIQLDEDDTEKLQPGKYSVEITVSEGGKEYTDTFDFQWGVLAINTNQTTYAVGATTTIMMGAVSENGNTLCEATLQLYVFDPTEYIYSIPVERSGACNGNNVTEVADYSALFVPTVPGTYEMYLEHIDPQGDTVLAHTYDTFVVREQAPLVIRRDGPTRINPRFDYPMTLTITATEDFTGDVIERVPYDFGIVETDAVVALGVDGAQELRWPITLSGGESVSVTYQFDAPDISPYLYNLGPAQIVDETQAVVVSEFISEGTPFAQESVVDQVQPDTEMSLESTTPAPIEETTMEASAPEPIPETPVSPTETVRVVEETANSSLNEPVASSSDEIVSESDESVSHGGTTTDVASSTPETEDTSVDTQDTQNGFEEHRRWQIASDATGSALVYWDSTIIPTGWTCVSCLPGDVFYQRFVVGSSTAGTNGGAATHGHTASAAVQQTAAAGVSATGGGGADTAVNTHTHTFTPTIGTGNNLPPYRSLVLIQHNSAGSPATLPTGAIAIFDATVPAGWTQYAAQNGYYLRTDATGSIGATGGAATHTHTITGTTGASNVNTNAPGTTGVSSALNTHTHGVNTVSSSANHEPPYIEAILGKLNATTTPTDNMILMWTDEAPAGWNTVSSSSEPFENRFVRAHTAYGATGGATTHTHSNHTITSNGPTGTANRTANAANADASGSHTHPINMSGYSTASNLPPFRTAVFAKRSPGGAPPEITLHTPFAYERTSTSTLTLEFTGNDPDGTDTLVYQVQWDDDIDVATSPLGDRTSDNETGCSPNCFTNTINGGDTHPYTDNERMRFEAPTSLTDGVTYYYRVRVKETIGDTWSAWSGIRSVTYTSGLDLSEWFQTEGAQFNSGTFVNAATTTGSVEIASLDTEVPTIGDVTEAGVAGNTLTLDKPANVAAGDLLLIIVGNDDDTATAQWDNTTFKPTGFEFINAAGNTTADAHVAAFYRVADGTEGATINVPAQSSDDYWGFYIQVIGASTTNPINITSTPYNGGALTTHNITGMTTTLDDTLAFYALSGDGGDTFPFSVGGAWTEGGEVQQGTGGTNAAGTWGTRPMTSAGATGNASVTMNVSDSASGFQFAVNPGAPRGTVLSEEIPFITLPNRASWGEIDWTVFEPTGTRATVRVYYSDVTACDTPVPNGALPGNGAGFSSDRAPIRIDTLSTSTYDGLCLQAILDKGTGAESPELLDWTVRWVITPQFVQSDYRWYVNANTLSLTDPWPVGGDDLIENESINADDPVKQGDVVRLRMSLTASSTEALADSTSFVLQYASGGSCAALYEWHDVAPIGSTTAAWRGYNNAAVSDGATLGSTLLTNSDFGQTYEEENSSLPNPQAMDPGETAEWDWVLEQHAATPGAQYCFRMARAGGDAFSEYQNYPTLITNFAPNQPILYRPFDNEKVASTTPWFEFVSDDQEGNDVDYQIQIDTDADFSSTIIDTNSIVNLTDFINLETLSDKSPFRSAERMRYVLPSALSNNTTYWWRVRAIDGAGSEQYGEWSPAYSFTTDTTVTISTWFQTTEEQFDTNLLEGTDATGADLVQFASGSTTGTTTSSAIDFSDATTGNAWGSFSFNETGAANNILYRIEYWTGSDWALIPNSDLPGNSAGFDTSPVDILNLNSAIYDRIRIRANFNAGSPTLLDWTVSWGERVAVPTHELPFDNEKFSTTTPSFLFSTTDPEGDDLEYEISWSTSQSFTSSTTRNSNTHAGFTNVSSGGDTNPFDSGDTIRFQVQPGDALSANTTYWWRVRAKDPADSNSFSFWSAPWSFTTATSGEPIDVSTWFQTTNEQFAQGVLTNATTTGGSVSIGGGIVLQNSWTSNTAVPGANLTLTKPADVEPGDLLLIIVGKDDDTNTAQWNDASFKPFGFTLINTSGSATPDAHAAAFYRVADGTEGTTVSVVSQSSDDYWGYYIRLTGVSTTTPIDVVGADYNGGSLTTHNIPGITTTANFGLAFYVLAADGGDNDPFSVGGSWTERAEIQAGAGAGNAGGTWGTRVMTTAGATGNASVTMSLSDSASGFQFALNPATISSATVVSPAIDFSDGDGPAWGLFSWSDSEPGGSEARYQVEYLNQVGEWEAIPDSALSGNAAGFTTGPVDLKTLNTSTYTQIRFVASLMCQGADCPVLNDWTVTWSGGFEISGTAFEYDGTSSTTAGSVAVAVNGALQIGKTGTISNGTWSIPNVTFFEDDVITVFTQGAADQDEAVAVTVYDGVPDMSGLILRKRHLTLGSDDLATTTNAHIGLYDFTQTEDIFFDVNAGNDLTLCAGGSCADASLQIRAGNAYTLEAGADVVTYSFENHGVFIPGSNTMRVRGSWENNGITTMTGSHVIFTATSSTAALDDADGVLDFHTLTFGETSGSATWGINDALDVNNTLTVAYGTLSRGTESIAVAGNLTTNANGFWTGIGTTTFDGINPSTWTDQNATKQNIGRVVVDGTSKTMILGSAALMESMTIGADDTFDLSTSGYTASVRGAWTNNNIFLPRTGTVAFVGTSTASINNGTSSFYNLTFNNAAGAWSFTTPTLTVSNDFTIATGTVTMPTATTTITGSFLNTGGTFAHNNATIRFNASSPETITLSGTPFTNAFYNVLFAGSGSWSFTEAYATTTNIFTITQGAVTLPSGVLALGNSFAQSGGSFAHNNGRVRFTGSGTSTIDVSGSSLNDLEFTGSGARSFLDASLTVLGDISAQNGTLTLPSGTLTLGGSLVNTATMLHASGTILFNSTDLGEIINLGNASLHTVTFNSGTGGWNITAPATTTGNVNLTSVGSFELSSGQTLSVGGVFTHAANGASTTWTGSTLSLESGSYTMNAKTHGGDTYGTLRIAPNTDIRMWNSTSSIYTVDTTGSLYSQDHNGVDGDLYIWGDYVRTSGTEYWSYATDFDGTSLVGGNERQVDVRIDGGTEQVQVFTAGGTFTPPAGVTAVDVLVVGGGGGGGSATGFANAGAGGGGAGGVVYQTDYAVTPLSGVTVTVGGGGNGGAAGNNSGSTGSPSTFGSLTALGGGGGIGGNGNGTAGGSGGGARGGTGGAGNQPGSASGGYGNKGGDSAGSPAGAAAGGGGGAGGAGQDRAGTAGEAGGNGGIGFLSDITGTPTYYAGGGGGGAAQNNGPVGQGGNGGGGNGGNNATVPTAGTANTGGGGGGGNNARVGAAGGSGVVIVRYTPSSRVTIQNATLDMRGAPTASTTVANQGSGAYGLRVQNGTVNAERYQIRNTNSNGLTLTGSTTITSLAHGDYALSQNGASMMTVSSTTINHNPALQISDVRFATTTGISSGYNVTQTDGTPGSYWWFRGLAGNRSGEAYDSDTGNPGSIRWDDSQITITVSGTVYSDDGVTPMGAPVCDGATPRVRIVVSGGTSFTGSCNAGTGAFSIPNVAFTGDPVLTVYLDTNGGTQGVVVTKTPTGNITNLNIYAHRVMTRHEDSAPLTILDMAVFDADNDSDIPFIAATGTLTVFPYTELHIASSTTFAPGGNITVQGNASTTSVDGSLHIDDFGHLLGAGTSTYTFGGSFTMDQGASFTHASTTVVMNATTTGKTITTPAAQEIGFHTLSFTGAGGGWNINGNIQAQNGIGVDAGVVSGTGNITVRGGSFIGNGQVSMGSGTTTIHTTNTLGGTTPWTFGNLVLGNGLVSGTTTQATNATTTVLSRLTIATGHTYVLGGGRLDLRGSGTVFVENGVFLEGTSTVRYSGTGSTNVLGTPYYNLELMALGGAPTFTATGIGLSVAQDLIVGGATTTTFTLDTNDPVVDVDGDVRINATGSLIGSGTALFTVGGDWINAGSFTGNTGTVTFDSGSSAAISAGNASFANVVINGAGAFAVQGHATATGAFTLTSAGSFTLQSGSTLAVGGAFQNNVSGGVTTWTGGVLSLYGSGTYTINTQSTSDSYATLRIANNTQIRMWNSDASAYDIAASGSLYSQDHAGADGELYIFGAYRKTSGTDFWNYARDFDGTSISGSPRAVHVRIASGSDVRYEGGALSVIGTSSASSTIQNQGSGTYAFTLGSGASTTWSRFVVRDTGSNGIIFGGTPLVHSMAFGDFEVAQNGGSAMTVGGTVITQNPAKTFTNIHFGTSTGITTAYNVTATGTTVSSWRFTNHSGAIAGEDFDNDPTGDPGYLVWDNSAALITVSGNVYSDEGVTVSGVCDGTTQNIALRVAGLTSYTTSCNAGTGAYTIPNVAFGPADSLVVFINGEAESAATVTVDPVSNITNLHLYENRVIVRHENTDPITIEDVAVWDASDDSDIPFTAEIDTPNTLTLPADHKLLVWTGKTFAPGGNVTVTGGGGGAAYDGTLELQTNAVFDAAGSESHTIGGSLLMGTGATFDDENSTITFTTSGAARTVDTNDQSFYNLVFNGSGSWTITNTTLTVANDLSITQGGVTLPAATTTIGGFFQNTGGSFDANGGTMVFTSTATEGIRAGGSNFNRLRIEGSGLFTLQGTHATATGDVVILNGTLTSVSGVLAIGGDFINNGLFTHANGTLSFSKNGATTITASSSDLSSVTFTGTGPYTFTDSDLALLGTLRINNGTVSLPTDTLAIGGSLIASGGTFNAATGTVLFNSSDTGEVITPGSSAFSHVTFGSPTGGWTITGNATTTGNFTLSSANAFTLSSGATLYVGGVFTNLVGGAGTTWTGSTIALHSGVGYTVNTKAAGGDAYNNLVVSSSTALRLWDSSGTITLLDSTSSVYSQDHAGIAGSLYIYGHYVRGTGSDYWSYATDFDGAALGGGSRQANVRLAQNATTTITGGSLAIVGTSGFRTTIEHQSAGTYALQLLGGTLGAQYYDMTDMNAAGLVLQGTTTVTSLSNGNLTLAVNGGTLISLASTTLNHNAGLVIANTVFGTTTPITGTNVTLSGETLNAWTFIGHSGALSGEDFDVDGVDACGSLRWDDSLCLLTQQSGYRFRANDGGEGVPDSEWFDLDWTKRARVTITNDDAVAYEDAAVAFTVPYDSDMQADFDDLRFTAADGLTPIAHFIESYETADEAYVWVKVPLLATSTQTAVFMYYGNGVVGDGSTTTVFTFIDTFEDDNISEYSGDTGLFNVGTGFAYDRTYGLDASGNESQKTTDGIYRTNVTVAQGEVLRYFQYIDTGAGSGDETCTLFGVQSPGSTNDNYAVCLELYGTDRVSIARDVDSNDTSGTVLASAPITYATGWYEVEIVWGLDDGIDVSVFKDDVLVATTSATDGTYTQGGVGFTFWFQNGGWDTYSSRPYLATEPVVTVGGEQVPGGASWLAPQNTPSSGAGIGETMRVRFLVENTGLAVTDQNYRIEYAAKGAAPSCEAVAGSNYAPVPAQASCGTSPVCMQSSSEVANEEATTDLLGGSGTFTAGQVIEDPSTATGDLDVAMGEFTEIEYVITPTVTVADPSYCLRVTDGGDTLDAYTRVAEFSLIFAPTVVSLSLNDGADIVLTAGATTTVHATGTVSDLNGYADLSLATTTIFRSGVGESCTPDNNNCYVAAPAQCALTNCAGVSCSVECSVDMYYHADPTDIGTFAGETWRALLSISDTSGSVATATAPSIDLLTLRALEVDNSINYGALAPSSDTGSYNATTTVANIGNDSIDVAIEGTDLTNGETSVIPVGGQRFATSTFTYSSCVFCGTLSSSSTSFMLDLVKPSSTTPPVTDDLYWGLAVPFGVAGTPHYGANIFYAIGDI